MLQSRLEYPFRDPDLLRLALTHPSVAHEQGVLVQHNQRLEFLGDAVLQLVLTRILFEKFPAFGEGPLTKARAQLVNRRTLAEQGRCIGLGDHLVLSRGEEINHGRERPSALADAFEAVVGALFLDGGYEVAEKFVLRRFRDFFGELEVIPNLENPKGELQEILQAQSPEPLHYQLASVSGPDHDRVFESAVYYRGSELGRGSGKSKKEAESQAALHALEALRQEQKTSDTEG
jgi:ribonuclease-3